MSEGNRNEDQENWSSVASFLLGRSVLGYVRKVNTRTIVKGKRVGRYRRETWDIGKGVVDTGEGWV